MARTLNGGGTLQPLPARRAQEAITLIRADAGSQLLLTARADADSHGGSAARLRVADRHEITEGYRELMRRITICSSGN